MEDAGVVKLYEPSPAPCLYVAPAENMVGRIPLMPCFLGLRQSLTSTARTRFHVSRRVVQTQLQRSCSNVYEVNSWLWQFGRGKPRIGGLTIEETAEKQDAARKSLDKRRKETREGCKGDRA